MTINEHHFYWDNGFLERQNSQRVIRLLREMQCTFHADQRCVQQQPTNDRRDEPSVVSRWSGQLWQTMR